MKIGILGGSFDPVHLGHLMMAQAAMDAFGLDKVIFVVANHSPFKSFGRNASAQDRLAMLRLSLKDNPRFETCDLELKRGGVSYTVETLRHFHATYPKAKLYFIIGEDNVGGLDRWKSIEEIYSLAEFIVIERDWFDVSSTLIRQHLKRKKSIRYLTSPAVMKYILKKNLYS